MAESDDLKRENEALRARSATLNAAILRINASLDLDTVLAEVVESARALTGARWGVIATVDETGEPRDFVFSGFTPEEQHELYTWRATDAAPLRSDRVQGQYGRACANPALAAATPSTASATKRLRMRR